MDCDVKIKSSCVVGKVSLTSPISVSESIHLSELIRGLDDIIIDASVSSTSCLVSLYSY